MYENRTDHLSNNLRLNEISILIFYQFYFKIKRNKLEIVVKATYGLHPNKYFEILNLTFWGRSVVTRRFGLQSISRGADEIKGLPISIDFCKRNMGIAAIYYYISMFSFVIFFEETCFCHLYAYLPACYYEIHFFHLTSIFT